jgi:hypothetical protein
MVHKVVIQYLIALHLQVAVKVLAKIMMVIPVDRDQVAAVLVV